VQVLASIAEMRAACRTVRRDGRTLGLVPTMGALHEGHLALVAASRRQCDATAVSIFVNPTQFAPGEDFAKYPRTFDQDRRLLEEAGAELLFAPAADEMYRPGAETLIDVEGIGGRLDGASRPGHFRGVATVVAKLFHIVAPDRAFFGQKDAAQVAVLRRMTRDLDFDLELVVCPTVREPDGLALSSRNRYLSPAERAQALVLWRSLAAASAAWSAGESEAARLLEAARAVLAAEPAVQVDYLALVDPETLLPVEVAAPGALAAVAARVGTTRLIDNLLLPPRG
jgi:pantoate--beta-alanine ligase